MQKLDITITITDLGDNKYRSTFICNGNASATAVASCLKSISEGITTATHQEALKLLGTRYTESKPGIAEISNEIESMVHSITIQSLIDN